METKKREPEIENGRSGKRRMEGECGKYERRNWKIEGMS
jgi:hypothetical protein